MRRILMLLAVVLFAAGVVLAHGNEKHVMGAVTALSENSITVQTTTKETVTVYTTSDTKFVKSGAAAEMKDLKVGDRVVIHAKPEGDKLNASTVAFGKTPAHSEVPGMNMQH